MAGPVKAFNFDEGDTAAIVGAARARVRQVVIYAAAAGALTIKNGSASGEVLLQQSFGIGNHVMNIPDDGILATEGCFVAALSGTDNKLTIFLS